MSLNTSPATENGTQQPARPKALTIAAETIPPELKELNQWVLWKYDFDTKRGKWTKPPYLVNSNGFASSRDHSGWSSFDAALQRYQAGGFDGIGFVVTRDTGIVGIDLDHCFNRHIRAGEPWAIDIIQQFEGYTEFSPSGEGFRILVKGTLPDGIEGRKKGNVEIYSAGRYFTVTGHRLKNAPETIEFRQDQIDHLFQNIFREDQGKARTNRNGNGADHFLGDDELLAKAFSARNGDKLQRLFDGDFSTYPSRSEADMALCSMLAFWTQEEAQLDRLFRRSGLFREKWDEKHGARTYGQATVVKAFADRTEHYTGASPASEHLTTNSANTNDEGVSCSPEDPPVVEPEAVLFPEQAWSGPFATWRNIVTPCTESPQEYLWAACLITIGLALGRNIRIENPRPLFPNFYALLMGPTGDDRKSTALFYAQEALSQLGMTDQVDMLRGIQSSEAIYDSLSRMDGAKSLAYCDEFRSLLSVAKRKGTQDIIPRLASLYYCPARDSLNRHEDSTLVVDPFLSLIAATPAEYVQDLLGNMEVDGGFLNRFLTITGEVKGWKAIAPRPSGWDRFVREVREIKAHYDDAECLLRFTDESAALWTEFYVKWKTARQQWNERDRKLTARIDEHILKLAIVYSAINKHSRISVDALKTAIRIGKWLKASTLNAFGDVGRDAFSRGEKVVLDLVKSKGKMYRRYLQQWVHKKGINGEMLSRIVNSHVKNGHLREGADVSNAGQKKPWVEYVS